MSSSVKDECPHGFSDPQWCEDCTPRAKPVAEPVQVRADSHKAQYPGKCVECRDPIDVGDYILPDVRGGWNHEECV
jgi:hypothetical protein